jgi:hypothetical protein
MGGTFTTVILLLKGNAIAGHRPGPAALLAHGVSPHLWRRLRAC